MPSATLLNPWKLNPYLIAGLCADAGKPDSLKIFHELIYIMGVAGFLFHFIENTGGEQVCNHALKLCINKFTLLYGFSLMLDLPCVFDLIFLDF